MLRKGFYLQKIYSSPGTAYRRTTNKTTIIGAARSSHAVPQGRRIYVGRNACKNKNDMEIAYTSVAATSAKTT